MSRIEIEWPDAGAERVRAARGRLEQAAAPLRSLALDERIDALTRVLSLWTAADSPWRRELADALAACSPFHPRTLSEGLESGLRAWNPVRFAACCREELAMGSTSGTRALAPFEWTAVLAGGSIPMPTLLSGLLPLAVGSPVLLRETSRDPITGSLLKRSLESSEPALARAFETLSFPSDDDAALESFLEAPCVVATGSDETLRSISARLRPTQRWVAYGHRFSIAVLGPECAKDPVLLEHAASGLALDVARWDQSGCLSPVVAYLVGVDEPDRQAIARAIAEALDRLADSLPRGEIPREALASQALERSEARMRQASGRAVLAIEGKDATVLLDEDARPRPAPLGRFLRLQPVATATQLIDALEPFRGHLSNTALAGLNAEETTSLQRALADLGVSRFTSPGSLQTPPVDWPHDGMPLLLPMARFVRSDASVSQ